MPLKGREKLNMAIGDSMKRINAAVKQIYFSALQDIVELTPVDTGRARNNWFLTVTNPSVKETGTGGSNQLEKLPENVLGKKIFFTNNLPYMTTLEYGGFPNPVKLGSYDKQLGTYVKLSEGGFSKQAPQGFVRISLKRAQQKIKQI
jgi:hypothetical protein